LKETENNPLLNPGDEVIHARFGSGTIEYPKGKTAIVRFEHGLEECELGGLKKQVSLSTAIESQEWHSSLEVAAKCQAAAIQSVNDAWGVFSRSRISLLPHQLWVCHRVLRSWPIRYMVADDVGLGKTIEAGLMLWPLISKGLVRRLLILCPASLVEQWQVRLREMFDIRLSRYTADADTARSDFWNTHHQVVASLPTLRADNKGRHERMLEAEPWDMLIVDEAHHLNADESGGLTLGYSFVESLLEQRKVESCVFFTGTPHRGKSYGFWSLMKLLHPDKFDPKKEDAGQIAQLRDVLIRNNKSLVTDMDGNKLFKPVTVYPETFSYNPEEEAFYKLMTDFIVSGKTYATSLSAQRGNQVMLVLISMQKIASSSVAAIRKALKRRLVKIKGARDEITKNISLSKKEKAAISEFSDESFTLDDHQGDIDGILAEMSLSVVEGEIPHLESLVEAADAVDKETKIETIMGILEGQYKDRQVLFFTEFKETQSVLMTSLMNKYGEESVTFINGDERLEGLLLPDGKTVTKRIGRSDAAEQFNRGHIRFLISTEAGGEGIDLQERCNSMIHVDLPWNPMRLHQRVGRLNRYGQKKTVDVITLRNPATVESRIWDLLNTKLERIMEALGGAMDDPEDLLQLVLGMSSPSVFTDLFSNAHAIRKDRLDGWFDNKSTTFGGKEAIDTVKTLVGNAARFDLSALKDVPPVDLPDLRSFFENMLTLHQRRIIRSGEALSFKTPEPWLDEIGIRRKYNELVFNRDIPREESADKVIGVGHKVFDKAMQIAVEFPVALTFTSNIDYPLVVFQVFDRITGQSGHMRQAIVAVECRAIDQVHSWATLRDWQALEILNRIQSKGKSSNKPEIKVALLGRLVEQAHQRISSEVESFNFPFRIPEIRAIALIWSMNY